jgi:hypothetical protein
VVALLARAFLISFLLPVLILPGAFGKGYDPLGIDPKFHAQTLDLSVHDEARNGPRTVLEAADELEGRAVTGTWGLANAWKACD